MTAKVLEDRIVLQMLNDPRITALLPDLRAIKAAIDRINSPHCRDCAATRKRDRINAIRHAKQRILGADADTRSKLKSLLGVQSLKIVERNAQGKLLLRLI